jgi:hypothetical protein
VTVEMETLQKSRILIICICQLMLLLCALDEIIRSYYFIRAILVVICHRYADQCLGYGKEDHRKRQNTEVFRLLISLFSSVVMFVYWCRYFFTTF